MGALINVSLNLDKLDKTKVIKGKNGNYYNLTLSVNDTTGQYGDNVSAFNTQSMEERQAKTAKNYVGNGKVVWTDGTIVAAERTDSQPASQPQVADADFPF